MSSSLGLNGEFITGEAWHHRAPSKDNPLSPASNICINQRTAKSAAWGGRYPNAICMPGKLEV
eukprot:11216252-Lingulodinium_polyedra.AAC.1